MSILHASGEITVHFTDPALYHAYIEKDAAFAAFMREMSIQLLSANGDEMVVRGIVAEIMETLGLRFHDDD